MRSCTPNYLAPEVIDNQDWSVRADIFSFGFLIWDLFTEEIAFYEQWKEEALKDWIRTQSWKVYLQQMENEKLQELVEWCCNKDMHERPSIDKVIAYIDNFLCSSNGMVAMLK